MKAIAGNLFKWKWNEAHFKIFPRIRLHGKLVPIQNWEYKLWSIHGTQKWNTLKQVLHCDKYPSVDWIFKIYFYEWKGKLHDVVFTYHTIGDIAKYLSTLYVVGHIAIRVDDDWSKIYYLWRNNLFKICTKNANKLKVLTILGSLL